MATTFADTFGVPITVGDDVMVTAWGSGARLCDVRTTGTVLAFARTRVLVMVTHSATGERAGILRFAPGELSVLAHPASGFTFEGNRRRSLTTTTEK